MSCDGSCTLACADAAMLPPPLSFDRLGSSAGGGMVTVTCNGTGKVSALKIDRVVVDPEDVEALEDLILVAIQDAQVRASEAQQVEMNKLMSGMGGMPGSGRKPKPCKGPLGIPIPGTSC